MKQKPDKDILLGAHMSIADGIDCAMDLAVSIGCTALQIFTASNRSWSSKTISKEQIEGVTKKQKELSIPIISHCSYLINLASPNETVQKNSRSALIQELKRCHSLGIKYAVLHPGSRLELSEEKALQQTAQLLNEVIDQAQIKDVMILLETMAGQGSSIGGTFEQLAHLRSLIHHQQSIGICADTCHLFAQGYDLRTPTTYQAVWEKFDTQIGLEHLKVIHLNDSKKGLNSRVDRHEHIGKGELGIEAFRMLMNDPKLRPVIKILETPKTSLNDDLMNLTTLKGLLK